MTSVTVKSGLRLFLIAGEPSGDRLGAALMAGLKKTHDGQISFHGIGGPLMQAEGLESLFPMEELTHIGIAAILANLRPLLRRVRETAQAVVEMRPDALITIDIPEFSLRVADKVKPQAPNVPTIHYVAPTVWAWRPKRADKMARSIDHVLALLPFEPPYMQAAGMGCDFVGHPVVTEPLATPEEVAAFRDRNGIPPQDLVLLVLPGSRRSEVERLSPIFGGALDKIRAKHPALRVVVPVAPNVADLVAEHVANWPGDPILIDPRGQSSTQFQTEKQAGFGAANFALAASGTVSLELAANDTPMVIAYTANWLSRSLVQALLRIDTVTLVNLVAESRTIPECLSDRCTPEHIAQALDALLSDPAAQSAQRDAMALTMERLGRGGEPPGERAAKAILSVLGA